MTKKVPFIYAISINPILYLISQEITVISKFIKVSAIGIMNVS